MEKIEFGILKEDEVLSLILDKTLCVEAILKQIIFPTFSENPSKHDHQFINKLFKDNLEYLCSSDSITQKILQLSIFNQALMQNIASLYIADLCAKDPGKSFDEVSQNFFDGINANFYDLVARTMAAKKEPPEPGNTNIGSSNNE